MLLGLPRGNFNIEMGSYPEEDPGEGELINMHEENNCEKRMTMSQTK